MTKQKTVPELKAEIAANERQLAQLRHKQQQLENRAVYYEKGDRRKRAHRLITRGAAVPRRSSFVTVDGAQPICLAMARGPRPCFLRTLMAPRSSMRRCCPFLRSADSVIQ